MTQRVVSGQTYILTYDAENRLVSVSGAATASFTYDADGKQVKAVVGSTTTYYVGAHYQVDNGVVTKYYLAGASRIAMRKNGTLYYMLSDHLGSTSITLNSSGSKIAELRYKAWGETRYSSGTTYTAYQFTSQRNETALGLYFYNARWYDPSLGRFTSADTIVPTQTQGTQAWDRYAYVNNNPVKYTDPTGHRVDDGCSSDNGGCNLTDLQKARDAQAQARAEADRAKYLCKAGNDASCTPGIVVGGLISGELKLGWDASLVHWDEVGIDVAGITADVIVFAEPSVTNLEGAKALNGATSAVEFYTNAWGLWQGAETGTITEGKPDLVNVVLDFISVIPGPVGAASSALGLAWNLSQGFYIH